MLNTPLKSAFCGSFFNSTLPDLGSDPRNSSYARQLFRCTEQLFAESASVLKTAEVLDTPSDYYLVQADTLTLETTLLESPATMVKFRGLRVRALLSDRGEVLTEFDADKPIYILDLIVTEGPFQAKLSASFGPSDFNDFGERLGIRNSSKIELIPSFLNQMIGARP